MDGGDMSRSKSLERYKRYLKKVSNGRTGRSAAESPEKSKRVRVTSPRKKRKKAHSPNFIDITEAMHKSASKKNKNEPTAPQPAPQPAQKIQSRPGHPGPKRTLGEGKSTINETKRPLKRPKRPKRHTKRNRKHNSKRNIGRQISVNNTKIFTEEDVKKVEQKTADIRKTPASVMRKELEKIGVKTSGKSIRLLKDIYWYSKMSNINIQHEK